VKTLFLVFVTALITLSCDKHDVDANTMKDMWACSQTRNYDTLSMVRDLAGQWRLKVTYTQSGNDFPKKIVIVTLHRAGTYSIMEDNSVTASGHWKLTPAGDGITITTPESTNWLYGEVLLCGEHVLFSSSRRDGPDHLFERLN
jgi:hypothetical protein